ncbi:MAG TPA: hypothetical protein P5186_16185 [Candidatus Paceibacterota bacterium]|nr:hypothetical protein [Verrucomicrobiota bacterium]HRY49588.1 hypothetical protein [Candidatus Paceibacterota bacterium]
MKNNYGWRSTPWALDSQKLKESLVNYLRKRGTFKSMKCIEGNSDFVLRARLLELTLTRKLSGFIYLIAAEMQLEDRDGRTVKVYQQQGEVKRLDRISDQADEEAISIAFGLACDKTCEEIERDYSLQSIQQRSKPLTVEEWTRIENVLTAALQSTKAEDKIEAVHDLCDAMINNSIVRKAETIKQIISLFEDRDYEVRSKASTALGILARADTSLITELMGVLRKPSVSGLAAGYAATALAIVGPSAVKAIPLILESFPIINESVPVDKIQYYVPGKGDKTSGNYVNISSSGVVEMTKSVSVPMPDIELKLELEIVTERRLTGSYKCEYYAGGYALYKITGVDLGKEKANWQKWWDENKNKYGN